MIIYKKTKKSKMHRYILYRIRSEVTKDEKTKRAYLLLRQIERDIIKDKIYWYIWNINRKELNREYIRKAYGNFDQRFMNYPQFGKLVSCSFYRGIPSSLKVNKCKLIIQFDEKGKSLKGDIKKIVRNVQWQNDGYLIAKYDGFELETHKDEKERIIVDIPWLTEDGRFPLEYLDETAELTTRLQIELCRIEEYNNKYNWSDFDIYDAWIELEME